jgi:hypothetical protein
MLATLKSRTFCPLRGAHDLLPAQYVPQKPSFLKISFKIGYNKEIKITNWSFSKTILNQNYLRGRVSKYVTSGSKVIVLLCVSLGSSTVQSHDNLGSTRACAISGAVFNSQNDDMLKIYRRAAFDCAFFVGERTQYN